MPPLASPFLNKLRSLLLLGRVSNLPTVWSNCLAGWLICGGGDTGRFLLLCLGATLLYLSGMYLNDAVDVQFDRMHRPDRPIPSGTISLAAVWQLGLSFLGLGLLCFGLLGGKPLTWAILLSLSILLYDVIHKIFFLSPVIMAACRFFLILTAASVTEQGVNGYSIWVGLVLSAYIVGLSYLARKESVPGPLQFWPCIFLVAPLVLAMVVNRGSDQLPGIILCLLLTGWILQSLRHCYWAPQKNVGRSVAALLAGIMLVDLLAVGPGNMGTMLAFLFLFGLSLFFQRFIPAT